MLSFPDLLLKFCKLEECSKTALLLIEALKEVWRGGRAELKLEEICKFPHLL